MRKRLLKYLKRLLIVVFVLGALGVGVFTWLCYWPLEGSVDDVLTLVPEEVEFVLRGDWDDLQRTGWFDENIFEDPLHPEVANVAEKQLADAKARIADIENQINGNIPLPFEWAKFGVGKDVLPGEVVIAGRFCRGLGPDRGPPSWQELLILKKVSWRTKCVAALKHGFIRDQLGPDLAASAEGNGVYQLTFRNVRVTPERLRQGCGGGFVVPPENIWYLRRHKDVIAISNSDSLIQSVAQLAEGGSAQGSFAERPGFNVPRDPERLTAAIEMEPLHWYFERAFEYYPELKTLRRFLEPKALEKVNGNLSFAGRDLLSGSADVSYIQSQSPDVSRAVYSLAERSVREGIAQMVPAKDTFAVVTLRADPEYLLKSILNDVLEPGDRKLWEDNLRQMGEFNSVDDFLEDLSTRVGNQAMIALARLSGTFDKINPTEFFAGDVDPMPAAAIMVRVKEGANQQELDEYLSKKVPLLGFSEELERVEHRDFVFLRARLQQKILDFALVQPCFILANDHLIIATNETYMRQILDCVADRSVPALAQDRTFKQTMEALPARGHVGAFIDVEKLSRIPKEEEVADGRTGPPERQGFLWDRRGIWVNLEKDPREEALRYKTQIRSQWPARMTQEQQDQMWDQIERHVDDWKERFPDFVEEYRRDLESYRRLRGLGLVLGATDTNIGAHFAVVFRKAEDWLRWKR